MEYSSNCTVKNKEQEETQIYFIETNPGWKPNVNSTDPVHFDSINWGVFLFFSKESNC